jgi:hypothetical protein
LVLVNEPLSDKEILFLEKKCKDANREASIFFINEKRFEKFVTLLKKYGYKKD